MGKRVAIGLAAVLVVGGAGLYLARGQVFFYALRFMAPSHGFDTALKAAPPDYTSAAGWVALPETVELADYVPAGLDGAPGADVAAASAAGVTPAAAPAVGSKPVDVFFVHPTTYLRNGDWNDPLREGTSTEENTRWVLANQASAYNGCCNVYAPRYRQTSIYAFFAGDTAIQEQASELAYQDVERAFDAFLERIGEQRGFILASHSQGTFHLRTLLRERITGTPLVERLVAAYLIGGGVTLAELDEMPDLGACESATDLHCVIHWATYGPEGRAFETEPLLCTNPLSWSTEAEPAPASLNLGAVVPSGSFDTRFRGEDVARGVVFAPLGGPIPQHTGAQCEDGRLVVDEQTDPRFSGYATIGTQNYHGLDYALFYMNVRDNARERVDAYLASVRSVAAVEPLEPPTPDESPAADELPTPDEPPAADAAAP